MTLLLLAGTGEAKRIAWALSTSGRRVIASLAGATRDPEPLPVPTRIGGFGGEDGFRAFVKEEGISAVLDATHPFAAQITGRTARICADLGLPYCQLLRPAWEPVAQDRWTHIDRPEEAAAHIPSGATVFLATGRQTIAGFVGLAGRRVIARVVDPPTVPFPFEGGEFLIGRPPFREKGDARLFCVLGVDWIIAKNAGGTGGFGKIAAARSLGLPVLMLNRPVMPDAPRVDTVDGALGWVAGL